MEGKTAEAIIEEQEQTFAPVVATDATRASEEQKRYGAVLSVFMRIGFVALLAVFVLYLVGMPKPHIAVDEVSNFWTLKVDKYLEATGIDKGWSWLGSMGKSDFLTFGPIALLASITVICYASIIPMFLKKKDWIYASLAVLEILVLVLAASGALPSGGH